MAKKTHAQKVTEASHRITGAMNDVQSAAQHLGKTKAYDELASASGFGPFCEHAALMAQRAENSFSRAWAKVWREVDKLEKLALRANATKERR